jgi:hypothetical protein
MFSLIDPRAKPRTRERNRPRIYADKRGSHKIQFRMRINYANYNIFMALQGVKSLPSRESNLSALMVHGGDCFVALLLAMTLHRACVFSCPIRVYPRKSAASLFFPAVFRGHAMSTSMRMGSSNKLMTKLVYRAASAPSNTR